MKTLEWDNSNNTLKMIDQRLLPARLEVVAFDNYLQVIEAIKNMTVRGAPAIGVAAAFGLSLAAFRSNAKETSELQRLLNKAAQELVAARPTAVNLAWAIKQMETTINRFNGSADDLRQRTLQAAQSISDQEVEINKRMATYGARLIQDGDTIIHHCNTGALATVEWGTALGVIHMAFKQGKKINVLVDETRPRLQGARLTAWELQEYGIPYHIISDNAAGYFLRTGQANKVFFGADRVAANGDVANKIGSYMLALAAHDNNVPVYSVFPLSTVDITLANGDLIPIEERDPDEVLGIQIHDEPATPRGSKARNPAFDITPNRLITALITEKGVLYPPFRESLPPCFAE